LVSGATLSETLLHLLTRKPGQRRRRW
jgi:hypothetical protein